MSLLVNISTLVANSEIRTEVVEGIEFTVLPSKTLPPNIVMNEILYDDSVEVFKEQLTANEYRFEIKSNGSTACRGKITFESI